MTPTAPDGGPINEDEYADPFAVYCARCQTGPLQEDYQIEAWNPRHRLASWAFCEPCFLTLTGQIQTEISKGSAWGRLGTRPPASSPVRRPGRRRKSDP